MPAVGAVAQTDDGRIGHVAWVSAVGDGTVTVEEYNYYVAGGYDVRTVPTSDFRYLHLADVAPAPTLGSTRAAATAVDAAAAAPGRRGSHPHGDLTVTTPPGPGPPRPARRLVAVRRTVDRRGHPRPGDPHVLHAQTRVGESGVGRSEEVHDVFFQHGGAVGRLFGIRVRRADVGELTPREDEKNAAIDGTGEDDRVPVGDSFAIHHDVNPFGWLEQRFGRRVFEPAYLIGPRAGCIDDDAGAHHGALAGEPVLKLRADHPAGCTLERADRGIVRDQRPMMNGGAGRRQHEPCVIALRVIELRPSQQAALAQHRLGFEERALAEHPVQSHIPEQSQRVVQPHARGETPECNAVAPLQGKDELQGPYEVWGDLEKNAALAIGFDHQAHVSGFQVTQASVDQPARA